VEGATSKWSEPSSDFSPVDLVKDLGIGVWGLEIGDWALGFEVWVLWFMVYGAWLKV
jgi:hypothetical protein